MALGTQFLRTCGHLTNAKEWKTLGKGENILRSLLSTGTP